MPRNKRESLIYTVLMCFYHGALDEHLQRNTSYGSVKPHNDPRGLDQDSRSPTCFAMCMDWFVVSGPAKGFAFRFLVKPESPVLHKVIAVSCSMMVPLYDGDYHVPLRCP